MQRQFLNTALLFCGILLLGFDAAAQEKVARGPAANTNVRSGFAPSFSLDFALFYADYFGAPGAKKSSKSGLMSQVKTQNLREAVAQQSGKGSRTLGLQHVKVGFMWTDQNSSGLSLILRPDYASLPIEASDTFQTGSTRSVVREVDSRAGDVYSPAPTVKPLDAYALTLRNEKKFDLALGVFEDLTPRRVAYSEVLEFGLNGVHPRKFSGVKLNWSLATEPKLPGVEATGSDIQFQLVGIHGADDRADSVKSGAKTFDAAPASNDPYSGGAAYIGWASSRAVSLGFLFGVGDSSYENNIDHLGQTISLAGKRSETFGGLSALLKVGATKSTRIGLDVRFAHDSFSLVEKKAKPLNQRSVSITSTTPISSSWRALAGVHSGTSQRHEKLDATETYDVEGYQGDLGVVYAVDADLEIAILGAMERRSVKNSSGARTGGFGTTTPKNSIQRVGLKVNYIVPGS